MTPVFVDSVAWIALFNARDDLHAPALAKRKELYLSKTPLLATEFVLLEVSYAQSAPRCRTKTVPFLLGLQKQSTLTIMPVSSRSVVGGIALFEDRPDKEWSLTDCISFVVMKEHRITDAFTLDHHFVQAGYGDVWHSIQTDRALWRAGVTHPFPLPIHTPTHPYTFNTLVSA